MAVDIGGTKTLVAVFTPEGEVVESQKFRTPQVYEEFKQELAANVAKLSTNNFLGGAIGMPGQVDRALGISISAGPNLQWSNSPLAADLQSLINAPAAIENDANLAGLSEALLVKETYRKTLYITLSTGIGGGYVIDGLLDLNTLDAEVGHMIFERDGTFRTWESFASGKAIVAKYGKRASEIEDTTIWEEISLNIAIGIINVSAVLTPDVIIIGGGVGAHLEKFINPLNKKLAELKPGSLKLPAVIQAGRPEEAVIYGCYELAKQQSR
ncbi:MAG: ROK family protein [Patescibacteria group bacterium]